MILQQVYILIYLLESKGTALIERSFTYTSLLNLFHMSRITFEGFQLIQSKCLQPACLVDLFSLLQFYQ